MGFLLNYSLLYIQYIICFHLYYKLSISYWFNSSLCPIYLQYFIIARATHNTCLVRRSIHIEYWYRTRDAPSIDFFGADKVPVNETAYCSTVQKSLNGVDLASVCGEELYGQNKRHSTSIQYTSRELLGQFSFPFWSLEGGFVIRIGKKYIYRFIYTYITFFYDKYTEPI